MERTHARPERPCGLTRRRRLAKLLLLAVLLAAVFLAGTMFGAVDVSAPDILRILLFGQDSGVYTTIIREVRFPRNLLACMVGACLALSGAIMQGMMRNPMASPSILGVTSGASVTTYIMYLFFPAASSLIPLGAFCGALATTFLIFVFAWKGGLNPVRFILSGVALSAILSAVNNILTIRFPDALQGMAGFMVGGLSARSWPHVRMILPYFLAGLALALLYAGKLNVLLLGDELAVGLGVNVDRTRIALIAVSSLLAASISRFAIRPITRLEAEDSPPAVLCVPPGPRPPALCRSSAKRQPELCDGEAASAWSTSRNV